MEPVVNRPTAGMAPRRELLRHLVSPTHEVFMDPHDVTELARRCRAVSRALAGHAVFTHLTSAALRGWQVPEGVDIPIVAVTDKDAPHHDRRGVYVRRCDIPAGDRSIWAGVAVASAEWTIIELAEDLAFVDLVAIIDSAVHLEQCSVDSIWAALVPGRRGVRLLRRALGYVDGRSESWWESALRLLHELSGVHVEAQRIVKNPRGEFVARMDLWIKGTNRYPEYDGANHRDVYRHRSDLGREKGVNRQGFERYGYTASEIRHDAASILRDANVALGRPYDVAHLTWWLAEAQASTVTKAGQRRLQLRLNRFERSDPPRSASNRPQPRRVAQG